MTFFDFLKDINDTAKERLKTPITGAFFFSFVIWNWRPLVVLLFSDAQIEDRIVIVNNEYCSFWAIFWPLVLAFFYTLVVPKIMVAINNDLAPTKEKRVEDIYKTKKHQTSLKIELAKQEFELKNIETGNKQIEDLQQEVQKLRSSKDELIVNHKDEIGLLQAELNQMIKNYQTSSDNSSRLNNDLRVFNEDLNSELQELKKELSIDDRVFLALAKLTPQETSILRELTINGFDSMDPTIWGSLIPKFNELRLIETDAEDSFFVSNFGREVVDRVGNISL